MTSRHADVSVRVDSPTEGGHAPHMTSSRVELAREAMTRTGIGRTELAAKAGISVASLDRFLAGQRDPRLTEWDRLVAALNLGEAA